MAWLILGLSICVSLLIYLFLYTPYPFVWLIRHQKEEHHDKAPENIDAILKHVEILQDSTYPSAYPNATYDLYIPKDVAYTHVLIWIHGGAFIAGTSAGTRNFAIQLASQGVLVVAMNYAYAPRYPFPVQVKQVDELLCHLKDVFITKHIPDHLPFIIGGDSAGANIAANFTNHQVHPELCRKTGVELQSTQEIKGQILFCGPYDFCEDFHQPQFQSFAKFFKYIGWSYLGSRKWETLPVRKYASPIHYITKKHPPMYIVDGKKFSFLWQGKQLAELGEQMHIFTMSDFYEECPHEFQFDYQKYPKEANHVLQQTLQFLKQIK